jgi:pyruvate/2-oxoglutarate dehydrogenase complex dihydrolipoamide acyltransferase (E2) component
MGRVDKWLKKEGDVFRGTEALCEVTVSQDGVFDNYSDVQVAVDAHQPGVLSKILVQNGEIVAVDQPIAIFVDDLKEYMELVEASRIATAEAELIAEMKSDTDDATIKSNSKILMREIRHLMKKGNIEQDSEFAKELQYLARKSNPDLLSIFEASFDGQQFNEETFDVKFFIENAEEIVKESIEAKHNAS